MPIPVLGGLPWPVPIGCPSPPWKHGSGSRSKESCFLDQIKRMDVEGRPLALAWSLLRSVICVCVSVCACACVRMCRCVCICGERWGLGCTHTSELFPALSPTCPNSPSLPSSSKDQARSWPLLSRLDAAQSQMPSAGL